MISLKSSSSDTSFRKTSTASLKKSFHDQEKYLACSPQPLPFWTNAFNLRSAVTVQIFCLVFYTFNWTTALIPLLCTVLSAFIMWLHHKNYHHISFTSLFFLPIIFQIFFLYQYCYCLKVVGIFNSVSLSQTSIITVFTHKRKH